MKVLFSFCFFLTLLIPNRATSEPLKIGGMFDLSSKAGAQWGTSERDGFILAIEEFRKKHPDREVSYLIEDTAYSNARSISALHKLTSIDGVNLIVGPTWEVTSATMPICERKKIVCLTPSYNDAVFDDTSIHYTFSNWFDNREYSKVHADLINKSGYKKIAVVGTTSAYYDTLIDVLLTQTRVKPVFFERTHPEDKDFRAIIPKIPRDIDALVVFMLADGGAQNFYRQWTELREDRPPMFTDDNILYIDPPIDWEKSRLKIFYSVPDFKEDESFIHKFEKRFGKKPGSPSASTSYDATNILLNCAMPIKKTRDCVANTSDYKGASGTISFAGRQLSSNRKMKILSVTGNSPSQ